MISRMLCVLLTMIIKIDPIYVNKQIFMSIKSKILIIQGTVIEIGGADCSQKFPYVLLLIAITKI